MPKILKLEQHNRLEELEKLYRQTSDPVERTRFQIIWLLAPTHILHLEISMSKPQLRARGAKRSILSNI
jgi:hypothetical protein